MRRILPLILATILIMPQMLFAATAEDGYQLGRECYYDLLKSEEKKQQRANWESCITRFDEIYKKHPKSLRAADSLYTKGKMYEQLHEYSKNKNDLMTALTRYNSFVKEYPDHRLADDALYQIGTIRIDKLKQKDKGAKALNVILEKYPNGDMADDARVALEERGLPLKSSSNSEKNSNASVLLGVEHRSQDDLAQVAFFFSILPKYKSFTLDKDEENNKPRRLVIDFEQANLSNSLKKDINVASNLFERIRLAQKNESQTRAVLDLADAESYEILTLGENVIVSLNNKGLNKKEIKEKDTPISTPKIKEKNLKPLRAFPTKSDNSSWNIKRVVIDPGHGGKDPGAIGPHGTKEKDVALAISKRLANSLKKNLGVEVYLTRTRDKYLSLDERVEFANRKKADLFISVHANASTKKEAHGVETFFLNTASSKAAERLAAIENKGAGKKADDLQTILMDMLQNINTEESKSLAENVQKEMVNQLSRNYSKVSNLGVQSALFYVLAGTKCPGVLVETSFISNPREEFRLKNYNYQMRVASSITAGVKKYVTKQEKKYSKR